MKELAPEIRNTESRLRDLERANDRLRRFLYGGAAGLAVLLMGQAQFPELPKKAAVEAEKAASFEVLMTKDLRVVDEQGRTRIECKMDAGIPSMRFYDELGVARVRVVANSQWPVVELADDKGTQRISLGSSPSGPGILMQSAEGHPRAVLSANDDGPGLVLFDENRPRVLVGVKNKQPVMAVLNDDSKLSFEQPVPSDREEAESPR